MTLWVPPYPVAPWKLPPTMPLPRWMSSWSFPGPLSSASPAHLSFFSAWTLTAALLAATLEETGVLLFVVVVEVVVVSERF